MNGRPRFPKLTDFCPIEPLICVEDDYPRFYSPLALAAALYCRMSLYENYDEERLKLANIIDMLLAKDFKILTFKVDEKSDGGKTADIEPIPFLIQQLKFFKADEQIAKTRFETLLESLINKMFTPSIKSDRKKSEIYR